MGDVSELRLFSLQTQDFPSPLISLFHLNVINYSICFSSTLCSSFYSYLYYYVPFPTALIFFPTLDFIINLTSLFFLVAFFPQFLSVSFLLSLSPLSLSPFFSHFKCNIQVWPGQWFGALPGPENATPRMIDDDNDNDDEEGRYAHPGDRNGFPRYSWCHE